MTGEPGQIVAPNKGASVELDGPMWDGFLTFVREHYDYLASGTEGQQALAKQLTDRNIIKVGSQQTSGR